MLKLYRTIHLCNFRCNLFQKLSFIKIKHNNKTNNLLHTYKLGLQKLEHKTLVSPNQYKPEIKFCSTYYGNKVLFT